MQVVGWPRSLLRAGGYGAVELSPEGRDRLRVLSLWRESGNAKLVCSTFGVSRATLYRWRKRFEPRNLTTLQERTRRPRRMRQPTWSPELVKAVLQLREQYPPVGKGQAGGPAWARGVGDLGLDGGPHPGRSQSPATAARAEGKVVSAKRRRARRPYATRKPKGYVPSLPGDLVQVDTLELSPLPGVSLKQFTARDMVSRWDVMEVFSCATALCTRRFLDTLQARAPFPLRAIQVDGGSEFRAVFEAACAEREILLFELPPRSPKLNGRVERANRTHREEFYEVYELPWTVASLNVRLREWE